MSSDPGLTSTTLLAYVTNLIKQVVALYLMKPKTATKSPGF